ncbi:hypothetical protein BH11PSE14_BH11PSE14_06870 [soil metagenome]
MKRKGRQERGRLSGRMEPPDQGRLPERRQRIAHDAARLMAQGLGDLDLARRRAASEIGEQARDALPGADQVLDELRLRQRLYRGQAQQGALRKLREAAVEAMGFLAAFEPRLVGAVLDGTADEGSPVQLQLFCEPAEALPRFLEDRGIPARSSESRLRLPGGNISRIQTWQVSAAGTEVELAVLPLALLRQSLPGHDPGTTQPRAGIAAVRDLLEQMDGAPQNGLDRP